MKMEIAVFMSFWQEMQLTDMQLLLRFLHMLIIIWYI